MISPNLPLIGGTRIIISSLDQFQSPGVGQYHPSLASLWRQNLPAYGRKHEPVLSQIVAVEPMIGEVCFRNNDGEDDLFLSPYLEDITRTEFPRESRDELPQSSSSSFSSDEPKATGEKFEKTLPPLSSYLRMETPRELIQKLAVIESQKERLRANPRLMLDTLYLHQLSTQVQEVEAVLGSLRGKNNLGSLGTIAVEQPRGSLAFTIADQTIYILPTTRATLVAGFFSTPEKESQYSRPYVLTWNENKSDPTNTSILLDLLLKTEVATKDRAFAEVQLRSLERRALIRQGLTLWEQGGETQSERARRYLRGSLTPMEQFSLLPQLMSQQGTPESDRHIWSTLRDVLQRGTSLSCLPPQLQIYFVRPKKEYPLVDEILQRMARSTSQGAPPNNSDSSVENSSSLTMEKRIDLVQELLSSKMYEDGLHPSFSTLQTVEQQDFLGKVDSFLDGGKSK